MGSDKGLEAQLPGRAVTKQRGMGLIGSEARWRHLCLHFPWRLPQENRPGLGVPRRSSEAP